MNNNRIIKDSLTSNRKYEKKYYLKKDLERMTTFQLREICFEQKLAKSIISPLDKEDLIRLIMRYRGLNENSLIREFSQEGIERIQNFLTSVSMSVEFNKDIKGPSIIVSYYGLRMDSIDDFSITYNEKFAQTNAILVSSDNKICGLFNIERCNNNKDYLYITKSNYSFVQQSENKNYNLYLFEKSTSEFLFNLYSGFEFSAPSQIKVSSISILDLHVKQPFQTNSPIVIDFGTSNTSAGAVIDETIFASVKPDIKSDFTDGEINYVTFINDSNNKYLKTPIIPSVMGVVKIHDEYNIEYSYGYEALRISDISLISEDFCIFYDIKRWISDINKYEEITDRYGARVYVLRKQLIASYIKYILEISEQRFKSKFSRIVMPYPIKQREQFEDLTYNLFDENAGVYIELMIDESVATVYNTIDNIIKDDNYIEGEEYSALVLDCGGGTTNLSSCQFSILNERVSYKIDIISSYENGDSDFGGNNLTYIIMQFLKISIVKSLYKDTDLLDLNDIISSFDVDIFRYVDENSTKDLYLKLNEEYEKADKIMPTKFKNFENESKDVYFRIKNNFYFLFQLAERVKHEFFNNLSTLKIILCDVVDKNENNTIFMEIDRWKCSFMENNILIPVKKFNDIIITFYEVGNLIKGSVYGIFKRFFENLYEDDVLTEFSIIKLTGLSCKIDLFKDALKEFVPGKMVQFKRQNNDRSNSFELKLGVVKGMLNYIKSKEYGFSNFSIENNIASLPYLISVDTHTGNEKILIHSLDKHRKKGSISRSMDNLTVKLYLKDTDENTRCEYVYSCTYEDFNYITYEELEGSLGDIIEQHDTDSIIAEEVKFFVWANDEKWGFHVLPILRYEGELMSGNNTFFSFENETWVKNFFDGLK